MTLKELFYECAYVGNWETVGHDVNYKFIIDNDCLYIHFQGSNSITDWIRNFLFPTKVYGLYRVHRGFLEAWLEVRNIILDKIYEFDTMLTSLPPKPNYKFKKVIIVGYSHGGALCQIATQEIVYHRPDLKVEAYAFESPRCIKARKELRHYWENLKVIRNNNDIVTHVPPKIFGYNDLGTMIKIAGDTSLVSGKLPKCIKSHYPQCVLNGLIKNER